LRQDARFVGMFVLMRQSAFPSLASSCIKNWSGKSCLYDCTPAAWGCQMKRRQMK
jgi:hypothetical protein